LGIVYRWDRLGRVCGQFCAVGAVDAYAREHRALAAVRPVLHKDVPIVDPAGGIWTLVNQLQTLKLTGRGVGLTVCQNNLMEAIILAGGLGTRLASRLNHIPKSMAPVAGRSFLEILLDKLVDAGCSHIILSVGHLRDVILQRFGNHYRGVPIDYAVEESPLGTGGAIRMALSQALEPSVLVLNGDTYLEADLSALQKFHGSSGCRLTMAIVRVDDTARYGGVLIEDRFISGFFEKGRTGPGWINGGLYVIDKNFPWHADLPTHFSFETDVLLPFLSEIQPAAFRCEGYFLDIGIPEDLDRAQLELGGPHRVTPL
jgi:D-glycero-alpha-D-manno-heptose 1-phosphate guanylyltransferase